MPKSGTKEGGAPILERNYWSNTPSGLCASALALYTLPPFKMEIRSHHSSAQIPPVASILLQIKGGVWSAPMPFISSPCQAPGCCQNRAGLLFCPLSICMSSSLCQGLSSSRYPPVRSITYFAFVQNVRLTPTSSQHLPSLFPTLLSL